MTGHVVQVKPPATKAAIMPPAANKHPATAAAHESKAATAATQRSFIARLIGALIWAKAIPVSQSRGGECIHWWDSALDLV
jgi:hypothetical protein